MEKKREMCVDTLKNLLNVRGIFQIHASMHVNVRLCVFARSLLGLEVCDESDDNNVWAPQSRSLSGRNSNFINDRQSFKWIYGRTDAHKHIHTITPEKYMLTQAYIC